MATFIEAADIHMNQTHPHLVAEFADPANEEHFFEVFDRAYEKGPFTYDVHSFFDTHKLFCFIFFWAKP